MAGRHPGRRRRSGESPPAGPPGSEAALEIAARYLGTRPRTRWEVERRLRRAGATDETIGPTLDRLTALGYLDDAGFASWWLEQRDRHAPRGRRMIEAELRQHGVPRDVIEALRDEARPTAAEGEESLPGTDESRASIALSAHLRGRPVPAGDARAMQRLGAFLVRRGFDPETARSVLRAAMRRDADDGRPEPADHDPGP